jgi:hypothetical protein
VSGSPLVFDAVHVVSRPQPESAAGFSFPPFTPGSKSSSACEAQFEDLYGNGFDLVQPAG